MRKYKVARRALGAAPGAAALRFVCAVLAFALVVFAVPFGGLSSVYAAPAAKPLPTLTGDPREDIVNVALSQQGYTADDNGYNIFNYDFYGHESAETWCAVFVWWCAQKAGVPESVINKTADNEGFIAPETKTPRRGDLAVQAAHVSIYLYEDPDDPNYFYSIDGNVYRLDAPLNSYVKMLRFHKNQINKFLAPQYESAKTDAGRQSIGIAGGFTDVPANAWYADPVRVASAQGLMVGKGGSLFDPEGEVTYAESVALAARLYKRLAGDSSAFASADPWYKPYFDYAREKGVLSAQRQSAVPSEGAAATRGALAAMIANAVKPFGLPKLNKVSKLPDVSSATALYTPDEIVSLYNYGIVTGSDLYGTFRPESAISRAETAAIVIRAALPEYRREFELVPKP